MTGAQVKFNLIESWLAVVLIPGVSTAQAIRDLNNELGTYYTPQDFGKWRRADRPIPQPVQDYMLRCSIAHVVGQEIGTTVLLLQDEVLDRMAIALCPPGR